ncbi:MAG: class I SAM-dependent methyltransferase [Flavobacterium sp.]|nr:MAG: class I SAM-dependent methyltransferase [Flavobacterium sp.]
MECKICGSETIKVFNTKVLYKYDVDYFQCQACEFAQTEKPYWLDEAYISSMNLSDTGVMLRCERMSKITTSLICLFFNTKGTFLDYAGGYGVFTRTMRDIGFDFYWHDPYTQNVIARGFEGGLERKYDLVTTFESFEHFEFPMAEVENLLKITDTIVLTTDVSPTKPIDKNWWYIAPEHGQHIAFHSKKSFRFIAEKFGLHYYNAGNVHILTRKKLGVFASMLFGFRFAKHLLYVGYFVFSPFLKSKSVPDMNSFYQKAKT